MPTTPTDILTRLRDANPTPVSPERAQEPAAQAALKRIINDPGLDAISRSPQRAGRPRRWLHVAPVLASTLVALAVLGGALVLLGRSHGPASGSRPPGGGIRALIAHTPRRQLQRELGYVFTAIASVESTSPCKLHQPSRTTFLQGPPGRALLSILGVLRRPATAADQLNLHGLGPIPSVYRGHIRRAFAAGETSYYIVPARSDSAASIPSERCLELETAAFDRYLPRIPAAQRQATREIDAALSAYWHSLASQAPLDTVCLVSVTGTTTSSSCGMAPKGIEDGLATDNAPGPPPETFSGVVPDGVATVTVIFPPPAHAVTTRVEGNVYSVPVPVHGVHGSPPSPIVIWRSPQGRVLKRISTSPAAVRALICKQSPGACLFLDALAEASTSSSGARVSSAPVRTR